jgi:hypothetical protein
LVIKLHIVKIPYIHWIIFRCFYTTACDICVKYGFLYFKIFIYIKTPRCLVHSHHCTRNKLEYHKSILQLMHQLKLKLGLFYHTSLGMHSECWELNWMHIKWWILHPKLLNIFANSYVAPSLFLDPPLVPTY